MRKLIKAFSILLLIALSFSCTDLFDEAKYTSHKITIDENIENGSVTTDTESAIADTTITLTVIPNNTYNVQSLTVKDADGNEIKTTVDAEDSTLYKFKMPASDVTVSVVFGLIKSEGTISFATTTISKTTADSAFTNTLKKIGDGTVTYSSSDTNVATVDETTGMVTIKGEGTCTITATVTDSAAYTYATKTASYTLTVAEYVEVETYHEDFTSTRFYYAKDVQWSAVYSSGKGSVSGPKYPFKVDANGTGSQTTASDWPAGSYVLLEKNSETVKAGKIAGNTNTTKDVPTYTAWICSSSGAKLTKLGHKIIIIGLCDYGFMTINPKKNDISSTDYGTFFYTNSGWTASSKGKSSITVDFNNNGKKYPTYEEITAFINKNN